MMVFEQPHYGTSDAVGRSTPTNLDGIPGSLLSGNQQLETERPITEALQLHF